MRLILASFLVFSLSSGAGADEPPPKPPEPAKTYQPGDCRDYDRAIMKDDKEIIISGKLCLQPDGSWKVVE